MGGQKRDSNKNGNKTRRSQARRESKGLNFKRLRIPTKHYSALDVFTYPFMADAMKYFLNSYSTIPEPPHEIVNEFNRNVQNRSSANVCKFRRVKCVPTKKTSSCSVTGCCPCLMVTLLVQMYEPHKSRTNQNVGILTECCPCLMVKYMERYMEEVINKNRENEQLNLECVKKQNIYCNAIYKGCCPCKMINFIIKGLNKKIEQMEPKGGKNVTRIVRDVHKTDNDCRSNKLIQFMMDMLIKKSESIENNRLKTETAADNTTTNLRRSTCRCECALKSAASDFNESRRSSYFKDLERYSCPCRLVEMIRRIQSKDDKYRGRENIKNRSKTANKNNDIRRPYCSCSLLTRNYIKYKYVQNILRKQKLKEMMKNKNWKEGMKSEEDAKKANKLSQENIPEKKVKVNSSSDVVCCKCSLSRFMRITLHRELESDTAPNVGRKSGLKIACSSDCIGKGCCDCCPCTILHQSRSERQRFYIPTMMEWEKRKAEWGLEKIKKNIHQKNNTDEYVEDMALIALRKTNLKDKLLQTGTFPLWLLSEPLRLTFLDDTVYEGYFEQMVLNGHSSLTFPDGEVYKGNLKNGLLHGFGRMKWNDGSCYVGNWRKNQKHGKGFEVVYEEDEKGNHTVRLAHLGLWKKGKKDGNGITVFGENNWYDGEWEDGKMSGFGIRSYDKGSYYIGLWKDGLPQGEGIMMWPNHDIYNGEWNEGKMHGKGTYTWNAFQVTEWLISPFQNAFIGEWKNGIRDGLGTLYLSSGAKLKAMWVEGKKHGFGELLCTNGAVIRNDTFFYKDKIAYAMKPKMTPDTQLSAKSDRKISFLSSASSNLGTEEITGGQDWI